MDQSTNGEAWPGEAERPHASGAASPGRGGRMSRQRKTAAVLRLLRGEDLERRLAQPWCDRGNAERLARRVPGRRRSDPDNQARDG